MGTGIIHIDWDSQKSELVLIAPRRALEKAQLLLQFNIDQQKELLFIKEQALQAEERLRV